MARRQVSTVTCKAVSLLCNYIYVLEQALLSKSSHCSACTVCRNPSDERGLMFVFVILRGRLACHQWRLWTPFLHMIAHPPFAEDKAGKQSCEEPRIAHDPVAWCFHRSLDSCSNLIGSSPAVLDIELKQQCPWLPSMRACFLRENSRSVC